MQNVTGAHYCYILENTYEPHVNRTYNGYTNNPNRRIRQHNQEIKGGAKVTTRYGNKSWIYSAIVKGFPDEVNALQCEWRIKKPTGNRKRPKKYSTPRGRILGLEEVLKREYWTEQSIYQNSDIQLEVWILDKYQNLLNDLPDNIKVNYVETIDPHIIN